MSTTRKSISDADALLLYQVGPVYCCSPTLPVESVIMPPRLTHPPGTTSAMPGVFKFSSGIVHVVDLRKRFGVDDDDRREPGRIVVVEVEGGHAGIWVDEIIDVIQFPSKGWGPVPAHIPRNLFSKTLLYDKKIMLYADFDALHKFREAGYLRQHIEVLKKETAQKQTVDGSAPVNSVEKNTIGKKSLAENLPVKEQGNHASTVITDTKQPNTAQVNQSGLGQANEVVVSHNNASVIPEKHKSTESEITGHPIAKNRLPEPRRVVSNTLKSAIQHQNNTNSNRVTDSKKAKATSKSHLVNKKVFQSSAVRQTNYAVTNHNEDNNERSTSVTTDQFYQDSTGKPNEHSSESNMAIWILSIVIMAMLLVMYYSFDDLFPEKVKKSPEVELSWKDPVAETQVNDDQSSIEVNSESVVSDVSFVVSEAPVAVIEKPTLNEYRAEIAHSKDDIVIVLQQPENDDDVFNKDSMESNMVTFSQQDNLPLQEAAEINNEAELDTVEIIKQKEENELESIIPVKEKVEKSGNLQAGSAVLALDQERNNSNKMQVALVVSQDIEIQKESNKKQVIHVVVKGDTLWHIAKRYIKNPYRYPELARLSKIKNPDLIYPGNKVIIIIETKKNKQAN